MANFFTNILEGLGILKKEKKEVPKFKGTTPFASLKDIPEIKEQFLPTLKERLAGRGVGFDEKELSAVTSPFAAERRAGLKEQTIPQISAQASARGLGRSTIPVNRIALASGAAERDIGSQIAQLRLANEQQKRNEINAALQSLGVFGTQEAATRAGKAGFDLGEFQTRRGLDIQGEQFGSQLQSSNLQSSVANALSGLTLGLKAGGVGGFAPSPLFAGVPGVSAPGANVNIPGLGDVSAEELAILKQLLGG